MAAADSSPREVIAAILHGVLKGIGEEITPPEKIYGNAFLDQYDFPQLTQSYSEAKEKFERGELYKLL